MLLCFSGPWSLALKISRVWSLEDNPDKVHKCSGHMKLFNCANGEPSAHPQSARAQIVPRWWLMARCAAHDSLRWLASARPSGSWEPSLRIMALDIPDFYGENYWQKQKQIAIIFYTVVSPEKSSTKSFC